ncbi:MAG TPA: universal stress protein, partial [Polyangiaceae bacterium]
MLRNAHILAGFLFAAAVCPELGCVSVPSEGAQPVLATHVQDWRDEVIYQVLVDRFADDALVEAATELHVDLIVTGTSEQSKLRRWLLGSVTESVVRTAPCSVLVARTGDPERGFQRVVVGTDFSPPADVALERACDLAAPGAELDVVHCFHLAFPAAAPDQLPLGPDPRTLHGQL